MPPWRRRILRVDAETLQALLRSLPGVPDGIEILSGQWDFTRAGMDLLVTHPDFPETWIGEPLYVDRLSALVTEAP